MLLLCRTTFKSLSLRKVFLWSSSISSLPILHTTKLLSIAAPTHSLLAWQIADWLVFDRVLFINRHRPRHCWTTNNPSPCESPFEQRYSEPVYVFICAYMFLYRYWSPYVRRITPYGSDLWKSIRTRHFTASLCDWWRSMKWIHKEGISYRRRTGVPRSNSARLRTMTKAEPCAQYRLRCGAVRYTYLCYS